MKIENVQDEITSIWEDIEPTIDKHLIETIDKHEGQNEKLNDKMKLFGQKTKIL